MQLFARIAADVDSLVSKVHTELVDGEGSLTWSHAASIATQYAHQLAQVVFSRLDSTESQQEVKQALTQAANVFYQTALAAALIHPGASSLVAAAVGAPMRAVFITLIRHEALSVLGMLVQGTVLAKAETSPAAVATATPPSPPDSPPGT